MNIVYLHAHDAGRFVQPYGYPVDTPNLMRFAREGVLFRKAFACAPTCGPSRSALLTGTCPHRHGMFGLPGAEGWLVDDYGKHVVNILNRAGYLTVLCGVQHEAPHKDFSAIGYQRVLEGEAPAHAMLGEFHQDSIDRAERFLAEERGDRPFFLSIGIDEPHRDNIPRPEIGLHGGGDRFSKTRFYDPARLDARYTAPPPWMADLPEIRQDMESFRVGVRIMDEYMGRVLDALDHHGLRENTLVIVTTDHGIEFPGGKMTLSDQGLGVMLMMRGPAGSDFAGGKVVEPIVSHLDVLPTLFDVIGLPVPAHCEGRSLLPLVQGKVANLHDEIFGEQTYHGRMDAMRCVRTERYKYVRRHDPKGPIVRQAGPASPIAEGLGFFDREIGTEQLYDCHLDPMESCNRAGDPALAAVKADLSARLDAWMKATGDCFPSGRFPRPANW